MMGFPPRTDSRASPRQRGQQERAEALTGDRAGAENRKAITRDDAARLGAVKLQSALVSAAPTAADHNALVNDIRALAAVLNGMGANFTGL
jgi:hypothetical protein